MSLIIVPIDVHDLYICGCKVVISFVELLCSTLCLIQKELHVSTKNQSLNNCDLACHISLCLWLRSLPTDGIDCCKSQYTNTIYITSYFLREMAKSKIIRRGCKTTETISSFEPRREKTGFLHMQKQRRRSASR